MATHCNQRNISATKDLNKKFSRYASPHFLFFLYSYLLCFDRGLGIMFTVISKSNSLTRVQADNVDFSITIVLFVRGVFE